MHRFTYIKCMALLWQEQVLFACSSLEGTKKAKVCILRCSYVNFCLCVWVFVCVCWLSGSGYIARCLLTYWGFVVVVGGLLAVQTTEKELPIFSVFLSACVCVCEFIFEYRSYSISFALCFVTRLGGYGFRCSATWVHVSLLQSASLCLQLSWCWHFYSIFPILLWAVVVSHAGVPAAGNKCRRPSHFTLQWISVSPFSKWSCAV